MADVPITPVNPTPTAEEVVTTYGSKVYNLAYRMLGSTADAEDVTQDVLLTVVRKLHTFRGESSLGTWLHRITVNACLAYRRKRATRAQHEIPDPLLQDFADSGQHARPVSSWSQPDVRLLQRETQDLVEEALTELPDVYRDVYLLADVEGLANAEIAEILGMNVPGVKSRLHRARLMMRQALAHHFEESRT